tara:strand:+ start:2167 stop:2766 length:600 start_codon:yes stop_codon:yes gene_type:complete
MKRVFLKSNSLSPNFIGSWMLDSTLICDEMINYFENHTELQKSGSSGFKVDKEIKDSSDINLSPADINLPGNQVFNDYFKNLFKCYEDYLNQWPFLSQIAHDLEIGTFNLQRYNSGQHFKRVHTERSSLENLQRILVFMTYLNDVDLGGSTYFSHYDLNVSPVKGLTLIWPAEWTHAHKGNIIEKGDKYIITGWLHFPK